MSVAPRRARIWPPIRQGRIQEASQTMGHQTMGPQTVVRPKRVRQTLGGQMPMAYLAGPDVFFKDALRLAEEKKKICLEYGILGLTPVDAEMAGEAKDVIEGGGTPSRRMWQDIFESNLAIMRRSHIVIANITPFRGASADAGTLMEIGWFWGQGRKIYAYSSVAECLGSRSREYILRHPEEDKTSVEDFSLPDNLMLVGAIQLMGGVILAPENGSTADCSNLGMFRAAVKAAAASLFAHKRSAS